ncbi:MAG TPA: RNA polymerase sigma-70 factor [Bacteroidales bacterium]|nr:RNA polymerase sigma-70 factor [Bacteroidales bacterium]
MKNQLALRIRNGDECSFELLFRKYYVRLCGFANKFLKDPEEAREIVQDVFLKLWEKRKDIKPDDSLVSYLFMITRNKSINKLRRKSVESKYTGILQLVYAENREISPHESLLANDLDNEFTVAVEKLPVKCREIFDLSRIEGLRYSEIATLRKISVKTVEAQMSKALKILRIELKDYLMIVLFFLPASF